MSPKKESAMSQQNQPLKSAALNAAEAAAARQLAVLFLRPGVSLPMAETLARLAVTFLRDQPSFAAQAHSPEEAFVRTHCRPAAEGRVLGADLRRSFLVWKLGSHPDSAAGRPRRGRGDGVESALIRAAVASFPDAKAVATARVGSRRGRGVRGLELLPVLPDSPGADAPLAKEGASLPVSALPRVEGAALAAALAVGQSADTSEKIAAAGAVAGACLTSVETMDGATS